MNLRYDTFTDDFRLNSTGTIVFVQYTTQVNALSCAAGMSRRYQVFDDTRPEAPELAPVSGTQRKPTSPAGLFDVLCDLSEGMRSSLRASFLSPPPSVVAPPDAVLAAVPAMLLGALRDLTDLPHRLPSPADLALPTAAHTVVTFSSTSSTSVVGPDGVERTQSVETVTTRGPDGEQSTRRVVRDSDGSETVSVTRGAPEQSLGSFGLGAGYGLHPSPERSSTCDSGDGADAVDVYRPRLPHFAQDLMDLLWGQ
jgi:hypothetical protein